MAALALSFSASICSDSFCTRAYAEAQLGAFSNPDIEKKMSIAFDLVKNKDYDKALEICNGLIADYPRDPQLLLARAFFKCDMKDYNGALADTNAAVSIYPKLKYAYELLAEINYKQGNWEASIKDATRAIEDGPDSPILCYWYRASASEKLKNYEMAKADLTQLMAIDAKNPTYYSKRSKIYMEEKNYTQALVDIDKAIELDPSVAGYYMRKHNIQLRLKNYAGALESVDKTLVLLKDNNLISKTLSKKSNVLFKLNRFDESIAAAEQAIQLDPNNIDAYYNRGMSKSFKYKDGSGISDLTVCINKNYNLKRAYYVRGLGYHSERNFNEAITDYSKAIELNPQNGNAYINRGKCYRAIGNMEAARNDFKKAIDVALVPNQHKEPKMN